MVWDLLEDPKSPVEEVFFGGCFRAGTIVRTWRGLVPIESVEINDKVLSLNEATRILEWKPVVNTFKHERKPRSLITMYIQGQSITSTYTHEYLINTEWVPAHKVAFSPYYNSHIGYSGGGMTAICIPTHEIVKKKTTITHTTEHVYDLEVQGNHNYCITDRNIIVHNSAGPGKSFLGCAWQIYRRIMYPGTVGFIGRASHRTLMDTTFKTFMKVWNAYGKHNPKGVTMKIVGSPKNAIFSNGSEIMFRYTKVNSGDTDAVELGSLEVTDIFIDELPENDKAHIELLMTRIRLNLIHDKPAALFAGNPSDNWVMEKYIQDAYEVPVVLPPDIAVVPALLDTNPDKKFVEGTKKRLDKIGDDFHRDRLLLGIWGGSRTNTEPFFYNYDEKKHKKPCLIDENHPLWISFDFNLDPTSAIIGQKIMGKGVFISLEKQMKGGTEILCNDILNAGLMDHPNFIFITGDSSGSKGSTAAGTEPGGRHITDYSVIQTTLDVSPGQIIHNRKVNERLAYSAKVCSYLFKKVPVYIDPGCAVLHKDLRTARRTPDGQLLKNRTSHKQDLGDAFRYLIHVMFPGGIEEIDRFVKGLGAEIEDHSVNAYLNDPELSSNASQILDNEQPKKPVKPTKSLLSDEDYL